MVYRSSTKYWFSVSDFLGIFAAFFRAIGTGSMFRVVQCIVRLWYHIGARLHSYSFLR